MKVAKLNIVIRSDTPVPRSTGVTGSVSANERPVWGHLDQSEAAADSGYRVSQGECTC